MNVPRYSYPRGLLAGVVRDVILLRPRDFHGDAKACIENLNPPLQVLGSENVPQEGPCVLTVNHYQRPGFRAEWIALAIAAQVPAPMHWLMTGEFTCAGKWYKPLVSVSSRIVLKRLAQIYGFTNMPPMPPRPRDVAARAAAVRAVLDYVKQVKDPILGLAPEGYDPPSQVLACPASGVGRFGLLLANAGLKFVPVGAYEADGFYCLHFGERYELCVGSNLSANEKDQQAARIIMEHIACLLPSHLRGEFA